MSINEMKLIIDQKALPIVAEAEAFEGVKRIAQTLSHDIMGVTGVLPEVVEKATGSQILCVTVGHSTLLDTMEKNGTFSAEEIRGKREVFKIALVKEPFEGADEVLVICGSDKRGTIYGMFTLSEYLGVTPLVFFGDAAPKRNPNPVIGKDIETVSKEPSVRYRGFFINDEWPCFGNWCMSHFGGVNAKMYENVFEFLLRMKGNYLWPAMWASSFPLDGPGSLNEELADIYGVVMGYSHHEPCLRASEEWDKVRGKGTRYGNEWNFYTNEQGLLNYWEDALKRSGKYENIITIGMRGERDSSMLGENATVAENVNLLKDIIRKQRQLIRENVNENLDQVPQMLALYKEVEAYFYGDENVEGLKDWDELDGVICMLCEDNFGHMRTLPTEDIRNRKGGFGMYYHFDYHGGPISYEWVDSTPMSKTWEQMSTAYEYGIRDLWIVNVGDLKFHEVPLTYFMAMAYDFDKWGVSNPDSYREFTAKWARESFPTASEDIQKKAAAVLTGYIDMNHMRRPESLNENIYHPCHYYEADRMIHTADVIEALCHEIMQNLNDREAEGFYSMCGFSAQASANLLKMHLFAKKSTMYANQGRPVANNFAILSQRCMQLDREMADKFAEFKGGKWKGMQLASHIGFTKWNDDGCRYPVISMLPPLPKNRLSVSRKDQEVVHVKNYGAPSKINVYDFLDAGCEKVILEVSNDGRDFEHPIHYEVVPANGKMPEWLSLSRSEGDLIPTRDNASATITSMQEVVLQCDRTKLPDVPETCVLLVRDKETTVAVEIHAVRVKKELLPRGTFLLSRGIIVMDAKHYVGYTETDEAAFRIIENYGQYGSAVKVFPSTASFVVGEEQPTLTYRFALSQGGDYLVELLAAPTNPCENGSEIRCCVYHGEERNIATFVKKGFRAGNTSDPEWCKGVLNQVHTAGTVMHFEPGIQEITIGALEAGMVLERIRIIKAGAGMASSYLGPEESDFTV